MVNIIKEEIAPGIVVYSNVVANSEYLYKNIEEDMILAGLSWQAAYVKSGDGDTSGINTNTRDTQTIGILYKGILEKSETEDLAAKFLNNMSNIFFEHFDPIEQDYKANYGISSTWHDVYGILKYGVGQKFTNHIDDHPDYHRRISTVYYLNDNYTGGEINFPRFGITFKPKANQMIIFPSTYVYNHSVSPVIEGERYAVVSWMK